VGEHEDGGRSSDRGSGRHASLREAAVDEPTEEQLLDHRGDHRDGEEEHDHLAGPAQGIDRDVAGAVLDAERRVDRRAGHGGDDETGDSEAEPDRQVDRPESEPEVPGEASQSLASCREPRHPGEGDDVAHDQERNGVRTEFDLVERCVLHGGPDGEHGEGQSDAGGEIDHGTDPHVTEPPPGAEPGAALRGRPPAVRSEHEAWHRCGVGAVPLAVAREVPTGGSDRASGRGGPFVEGHGVIVGARARRHPSWDRICAGTTTNPHPIWHTGRP
jgi:hypothetical protein